MHLTELNMVTTDGHSFHGIVHFYNYLNQKFVNIVGSDPDTFYLPYWDPTTELSTFDTLHDLDFIGGDGDLGWMG